MKTQISIVQESDMLIYFIKILNLFNLFNTFTKLQ